MPNELMKRRANYALETMRESWVLSFRQFFPLFLAWAASLAGPVFLLGLGLLGGGLIDHMMGSRSAGLATLIGFIVPGFLIGWLYAGWILVSLKVARGLNVKMVDMFRPLPQTLAASGVLVLTTICIGLTSWLVIPAALLFLKWQLAPYYVVDRGYGTIQAMKQSWHDTDRIFAPLAILDLIFFGIQWVSGVTFVGPFLCHMALAVASALVYSRWLSDENNPEFIVDKEALG